MPHIVRITQKNGSDIANEPTQGVLMAQIDLGTDLLKPVVKPNSLRDSLTQVKGAESAARAL